VFVVVSDVGVSANAGVNVRRLETEAVELLAVLLDFELDVVVVVVVEVNAPSSDNPSENPKVLF